MTGYTVDVDELAAAVAAMTSCQRDLADLAADVERETLGLHEGWAGLARDAHASAYSRWRGDFAEMATALEGLRAVGDVARANYTAAVEANVAMWGQLR
jgi:WXG100 family type VII secretion target